MSKRKKTRTGKSAALRSQASKASAQSSGQSLNSQIQALINRQRYTQAIRTLQQGLKRDPEQQVSLTEADILMLKGKDEFELKHYKQASHSFEQALVLGLKGDTHYWLAKCWLEQQQPEKALTLFQMAFEDKSLPKDLGGCYLKLLLLNDDVETVKQLVQSKSHRFYAPHLHWARGALALLDEETETALTHFEKMGRQASPGDHLSGWPAYAHQQLGQWHIADIDLGVTHSRSRYDGPFGLFRPRLPKHPARQQLTLVQSVKTKQDLSELFDLDDDHLPDWQAAVVSQILYYIDQDDFHNAVHVLLDAPMANLKDYPELEQSLYRPLMLLAGSQAQREQELDCTESFWSQALAKDRFDPNLALNLHTVFNQNNSYAEDQKLVHKMVKWVKQLAQQDSKHWPQKRLHSTLATLYSWLADSSMYMGRAREACRFVKEAEKLAPEHPEVLGRKGLQAYSSNQLELAIPLLTQALENGCKFEEVYDVLTEHLDEEGDREALKNLRRKYGKQFGDFVDENEVELPDWVECLTVPSYTLFEGLVAERSHPSPALEMLKIFLSAAREKTTKSDKITLNQTQAVPQWDKCLGESSDSEQVAMFQAICLAIQLYARKNKKGMTALFNRYLKQLLDLSAKVSDAASAHLVVNVLKPPQGNRLAGYVSSFLARSAQPGNALARVQLQAQRFGQTRVLMHDLDKLIQQDSQNPLLLLAKATCFNRNSADYRSYYDKGFELARRLQDAEALRAFREEDWLKAQSIRGKMLGPNVNAFMDPSQIDLSSMLRKMADEMFGEEVPQEVLDRLIPLLQAQMAAEVGGAFGSPFGDDDDDGDDDDFFGGFFIPPGLGQKSGKKKKPWFKL